MLTTRLTKRALQIASKAHSGQHDKAGEEYILHPIHVAEQMGDDEFAVCVALLHDVVEDTDVTFSELEEAFPTEIIEALKLLTHDDSVPYNEYITAIKNSGNRLAIKVKLADIAHNSSPERLSVERLGQKTFERLTKKYNDAKKILKEVTAEEV